MPRVQHRQEGGPESRESLMGDAVPRNGVEDQADRRAHMREQTTARQAAERDARRPSRDAHLDRLDRAAQALGRATELGVELTRINAEHQSWLREHDEIELPLFEGDVPPDGDEPALREG